jgi:NTP pyrophosphatase (non-canonical NTP hydrolase)
MNLKELVKKSHNTAIAKGFWEDKRQVSECLMLIVTEIAEACEADREADRQAFEEEIADTFIRLGDLCGWLNIDIEDAIKRKMKINEGRTYKHGKLY